MREEAADRGHVLLVVAPSTLDVDGGREQVIVESPVEGGHVLERILGLGLLFRREVRRAHPATL